MADENVSAEFVKLKPIGDLVKVTNPSGGYFAYYDEANDMKLTGINNFKALIVSGVKGEATPTSSPSPLLYKINITAAVTVPPGIGSTYTQGANTYRVDDVDLNDGLGNFLVAIVTGSAPASSGALNKASGTGDSVINYSSITLDQFEKWDVRTPGTYTNFKDTSNNPIIVTADDLEGKIVQIWVTNGVSKLEPLDLPIPSQNISKFEDLQFPAIQNTQAIYNNAYWRVKVGQTAAITDLPTLADNSKWSLIGDVPKIVNTDNLFNKDVQDLGIRQVTATGTISNAAVGSVYGVSISIGIIANRFNKITLPIVQNPATPITQIEVRLFQGKTVGGTLIVKKRQTITALTDAVINPVITFDLPMQYAGEMWIQILTNNPFAYKKVTPSVLRPSTGGYGTPAVTLVNNLDGTAFATSQPYSDMYVEFNTVGDVIVLTDTGEKTLASSIANDVDVDVTPDYTVINSWLLADGTVVSTANWRTTELLPVSPGDEYFCKTRTGPSGSAVGMVGYKADLSVVVLVPLGDFYASPYHVIIPTGIVAVRACGFMDQPPRIIKRGQLVKSELLPNDTRINVALTWNCVGHSIWQRDGELNGSGNVFIGIQTHVRRIFRFLGYNKYCYSGNSLGALTLGDTSSISNKYSAWTDTHAGFWTIDTITNDFKRNIPIGTITDYNNATGILTYYGALRAFKDKVVSLQPVGFTSKVIAFNALRRNLDGYTSTSASPVTGHTLLDYEKALMTVCALNDWQFTDQFRQSEITDETLTITTEDGLHPNNFGYNLAKKLPIRSIWLLVNEYHFTTNNL